MDFVVEKGTELGACRFSSFLLRAQRHAILGEEKLARWRRLARTSAQQSGRRDVPEIRRPVDSTRCSTSSMPTTPCFFAWELAPPLFAARDARARRFRVGTRARGGRSRGRLYACGSRAAAHRGARLLSLGPRILRTDTAAVALLAVIGALAS